jgi:hypothetical protein
MADEKIFKICIGEEIDKFFDDLSISPSGQPEFVLILGAVCTAT